MNANRIQEQVQWAYKLKPGSLVRLNDFYFKAGKNAHLFERGRTYTVGEIEMPQLGAPIVRLRLPSGELSDRISPIFVEPPDFR